MGIYSHSETLQLVVNPTTIQSQSRRPQNLLCIQTIISNELFKCLFKNISPVLPAPEICERGIIGVEYFLLDHH
jgi:hypothetical protein